MREEQWTTAGSRSGARGAPALRGEANQRGGGRGTIYEVRKRTTLYLSAFARLLS